MARSTSEIYDSLVIEKGQFNSLTELLPDFDNSQNFLNDVDSKSKVAEWRLWLWIVAFAAHTLEVFQDLFREDVLEIAEQSKSHNLKWYQKQCLDFQYGDDLVWSDANSKYAYESIDANKKIITRAASSESENILTLKVAKSDEKLTNAELAAFKEYVAEIKDAGTEVIVISSDADLFKMELDVYYDPLVLLANGKLIADNSVDPIAMAIESYLDNLPFDGKLSISALQDYLQAATGVIDPHIKSVQAKSSTGDYASVTRVYTPLSGWIAHDLSSTITFIPVNS